MFQFVMCSAFLFVFSVVPVERSTVISDQESLIKNLVKNLVKNPARNNAKNLVKNLTKIVAQKMKNTLGTQLPRYVKTLYIH